MHLFTKPHLPVFRTIGIAIINVAAASICLGVNETAKAISGFTLAFAPDQWTLSATGNFSTISGNCIEDFDASTNSCVDNSQLTTAQVFAGGFDQNPLITTTWAWVGNTGIDAVPYYVTFNLTCLDCGEVAYVVGSMSGTVDDTNSVPFTNVKIGVGQTISFTTTVPFSDGDGVQFSVNSFSYSVPGPLPAAGAATAFGYSRRLRRRIKGKRPDGSIPPLQPAHPAAYLNLTPSALKSVPVSFSYAAHSAPTDRSHQAA